MGAIAASGKPDALVLFRKVLIASSSIPGLLPPVYFRVQADGSDYTEMHVDGGATKQVFHLGFILDSHPSASGAATPAPVRQMRLYVIRNGLMRPEWGPVPSRATSILGRAVWTLVKWQALGDIFRLYALCHRQGIEFNLAYIPDEYVPSTTEEFNTKEMDRLFKIGYDLSRPGYQWRKAPPGVSWDDSTRPLVGTAGSASR
jgi:hypothetical protein